jgi:mono/diheme cytochrome c family protein
MVRGPEPPSHTHTSWIALHGKVIDGSCATCHEPPAGVEVTELEGKPPADDETFCGNSACHANEWDYAGFNAPALAPVLARQSYILQNTSPYLLEGVPLTYEETFESLFEGRCVFCHGGPNPEAGLDLSSYQGLLAGGDSGPAVVPGKPDESLILERQGGPRPHFGQVLQDELLALRAWIEAGAPQE